MHVKLEKFLMEQKQLLQPHTQHTAIWLCSADFFQAFLNVVGDK